MKLFSNLKKIPGPFYHLMVMLVSMALTDARMSKEVVERFIQKMKDREPADGSFLKQFTLFIRNNLLRPWLVNSPPDLTAPERLYHDAATELANCCALIYDSPYHVPDLEYRSNHRWNKGELESAIEKETVRYLFDLVEFSLKQVGMAEEAEDFKVKVRDDAAGVANFQSVKLCKGEMLQIESHKVKVIDPVIEIDQEDENLPTLVTLHTTVPLPAPPSNWKPPETTVTMASHNEKVIEAVTGVEDSDGQPEAKAVAVAEGASGGKRKAVADAGEAGPSFLKKRKLF